MEYTMKEHPLLRIGALFLLTVAVGVGALSAVAAVRRIDDGEAAERALAYRDEQVRKTCAAGGAILAVVEARFANGDADAEEMARDLLVYGLPWLDLCAGRRINPLPGADLRMEIQALRADLDRRYGVEK